MQIRGEFVEVEKNNFYGLIQISDGKVKIIEEAIHKNLAYFSDLHYITVNNQYEYTIYTGLNRKANLKSITNINMVPHFITDPETGEFVAQTTFKIHSGASVRLLKVDLPPSIMY